MAETVQKEDERKLSIQLLIEKLRERRERITFAESCTAGLLSATFCSVAGASEVYDGGIVSYANRIKSEYLEVATSTLTEAGAVSAACATEMCKGAAKMFKAELSLSVTGIAGPGGGSKEKPVGTVYIACYYKGKVTVTHNLFTGNRQEIREQSVRKALQMGLEALE